MEKIGKYTIHGEIGKGGMGIVYRGSDPYIGRTVAIKTVRLDILSQESGRDEALKRFLREAQAAGNLSHPNIVTIYDVGEHEGLIYIAMEYIDGSSLESLLRQGREFTLEEIGRLFGQIASALDYAHGQGIIHRDIKPANILVGRDLKVAIVDFGIARTSASTMTQTGMLMGTPRYMSPEQIAGKQVDSRSDIFSLGAILYELLTRRNPFEGESITTVIYKIMHAELPPLSDFNKHLPPGLERVVRKALARDADRRYATCGELAADLLQCGAEQSRADTVRESAPGAQQTQLLRSGWQGQAWGTGFHSALRQAAHGLDRGSEAQNSGGCPVESRRLQFPQIPARIQRSPQQRRIPRGPTISSEGRCCALQLGSR